MARLPGSGFSGKKSKVGFMLRDTSLDALNNFKERNGGIVRSPGEAIDYCCDLFLGVDGTSAAALYDILHAGAADMRDLLANPSLSQFEQQEIRIKADKIEEIAQHFRCLANADELSENREPMLRIDLAGEDYVLLPDDGSWAVVGGDEAKGHSYVGAVSVRGVDENAIPLIMFFSDRPISSMGKAECDKLVDSVSESYPELKEIRDREIEAAYDAEGNMINAVEWLACPRVGVFTVLDSSSYRNRDEAPGRALVYRAGK